MRKWLRLPWVMGIIVMLVGLIVAGYWFQWSWTGFPAKTLWDWLNLLGVLAIPVVVGLGAAWYTAQQGEVSNRENTDSQREAALVAYIDRMSELLLEKNLRQSEWDDEVRNIARVRTLTILRMLDPNRKANVLAFLNDAGLISKNTKFIMLVAADLRRANLSRFNIKNICLSNVNLRNADLSLADLSEADLSEAILRNADLSLSNLSGIDLSRADLGEANLNHANLSGANLSGANLKQAELILTNLSGANFNLADLSLACLKGAEGITNEQLSQVKSLKGAIMPDGSKHP